jgi:hypothetical protein
VREAARALAFGRIAFGVGAIVAPRLMAGAWVGGDGRTDGATVLTRALGARDVLLGFMALHTLDHPPVAARWQASLAGCDAVDGLASLRAGAPAVGVFALGTAAFEAALSQQLRQAATSA